MIEYLPWSRTVHKSNLKRYENGGFSCLDIELGGECNYHCVYCDSPDRDKKCTILFDGLENLLSTGEFAWIYICGLGEPTYNKNRKWLLELLGCCKKYGVRCSIFSNLSLMTEELEAYIKEGILHVFFKYDSYEHGITRTLYGAKDIKTQLHNIDKLKKLVVSEQGATNLAASIVPTRLNKEYILPIVQECIEADIYPLLGELELSGKGMVNYENLCLSAEELSEIKAQVETAIGETYKIPVCPSVLSGIHFSYDGYITVDRYSGLSCHWFWLKEPKVEKIMRFDSKSSVEEITEKIMNYRDNCMGLVKSYLQKDQKIGGAFGGCGGDVHQLFQEYLEHHRGGAFK